MRILILGTSNSILKDGWTYGLRAALPNAIFERHLVGASPGMQFGTDLNQDFSKFDFVLFDSIVNDEHLSRRIGEVSYNNRIIYEIMSSISATTNLITIGFTMVNFIARPSAQYMARRKMAAACESQFISFRDLTLKFGRNILGEGPELYEHIGHPDRKIAYAIGYALGQSLNNYSPRSRNLRRDYTSNFTCLSPAELIPGREITKFSNRLLSIELIELIPGDAIELIVPDHCIGFYLNSKQTKGIIRLDGPECSRYKELWYGLKEGLEVKFVPVTNGFLTNKIEILGENLPFEKSIHTSFDSWPGKNKSKINMGSILFWNGDRNAEIPDISGDHDIFQLHRNVDNFLSTSQKLVAA